jgi:AraC-like DNA-binding protein
MANEIFNDNSILYSCEYKKKFSNEIIVAEHGLSYIVSGKLQLQIGGQTFLYEAGDIGLVRRNELVRSMKIPDENGFPFKAINIFLSQNALISYASQKHIPKQERYSGKPIMNLSRNKFIKAYFDSLLPYFGEPERLSPNLADIKIAEAIELLLDANHDLKTFLFDLSEPFKIDIEKYMAKNFIYNIPVKEFARLTGRSLSTFKRDFKTLFDSTPEKWLKEKRLDEARYLITEKKEKPSDIYIQVGFENFSHFSSAFKQRFGLNASQIS